MFENLKQEMINKQVKSLLKERNLKSILCFLDENDNVSFQFNEEDVICKTKKDHETQINYITYLREQIREYKKTINQLNHPQK